MKHLELQHSLTIIGLIVLHNFFLQNKSYFFRWKSNVKKFIFKDRFFLFKECREKSEDVKFGCKLKHSLISLESNVHKL